MWEYTYTQTQTPLTGAHASFQDFALKKKNIIRKTKRQAVGWERIFVKCIFNQGLVCSQDT
jgi:hypothetical protein